MFLAARDESHDEWRIGAGKLARAGPRATSLGRLGAQLSPRSVCSRWRYRAGVSPGNCFFAARAAGLAVWCRCDRTLSAAVPCCREPPIRGPDCWAVLPLPTSERRLARELAPRRRSSASANLERRCRIRRPNDQHVALMGIWSGTHVGRHWLGVSLPAVSTSRPRSPFDRLSFVVAWPVCLHQRFPSLW